MTSNTHDPQSNQVELAELARLLNSLPEGAEIISRPAPLAGAKRTFSRTASKTTEPTVAGGLFFRERKRTKVTEKGDNDADMAVQEDAEAAKAKATLKAKFEEWEAKFAPRMEEDTEGTIRFINPRYPRFCPRWQWMRDDHIAKHERHDIWKEVEMNGKAFLFAQVYGSPTPTEDIVDTVVLALERHEQSGRVEGLKADEYEVKSVAKNKLGGVAATLVLICKDKEAAKRLLIAPAFTYEDDEDIAAVWDGFLVGCYGLFHDHIAWSNATKNKGKSVPVDFRIVKVTRAMVRPAALPKKGGRGKRAPERTQQQDQTTEMWRVAFKITSQAAKSWTIPRNGGPNGAKGELPDMASWLRLEFKLEGTDQVIECFYRDPLECIESLYGNLAWADVLHVAPERHYTDEMKATRMYNKMYTGNWWWRQQAKLEDGVTVVPIIVSSDKTSLKVLSTGKEAYPAYLTIGNIPKSVRRKPSMHAQLLFAYLPTEQFTGTTLSKKQISLAKTRAFHFAMKCIFATLESAGRDGVELESGDGKVRHCHPILAIYIADYPEQCLVTCTCYMHCPLCQVSPGQLGEYGQSDKRNQKETLRKLDKASQATTKAVASTILREAGITDTLEPFFSDLPFTNINHAITPDILHQLYQGLIKHLTGWITRIIGPKEFDLRFAQLLPNHALRIFKDGGAPSSVIRASCALLDFLSIAQFETHTNRSLEKLEHALKDFHDNKQAFLDTNACEGKYLISRLVSNLLHYAPQIRKFGATDNYNTENTERLHIDMAKDAYRATNHKDILPQMILWLERKERILAFSSYIKWGVLATRAVWKKASANTYTDYHWITLPKTPSIKHATLSDISQSHGAIDLQRALASFVTMQQRYLDVPRTPLPLSLILSVWYHFKISNLHIDHLAILNNFNESIHASPRRTPQRSQKVLPARFDTVLVNEMWDGRDVGLQ
ncbi:hypothetical protein FRC00_007874, partial [Tulasnella sp. 408]